MISVGQVPLQKYNGVSSIETPLDMVMSEVPNPYNCQLSVTPSLDISKLIECEYYNYVLALKPAAVGNGNNPTPYWDGYLKAAGVNPNEVFRDYLALLATTKSQGSTIKVTQDGEEDKQHDNSNDSQQ